MNDNLIKSKILVAGDVCIDWFALPVPRVADMVKDAQPALANWQLRDGFKMFARAGGAWLLADFVAKTTGQPVIRQPVPTPLEHQDCDTVLHTMIELKPFPRSNSENDRKDRKTQVWRVANFRGFAGPSLDGAKLGQVPITDDSETVDLVVLEDVGNGFRDNETSWPKTLKLAEVGPLILWKLARPLAHGALAKYLLSRHAARTIVVLDVDDLRAEGAAINRQLSWERTASDVIHVLTHDRHFAQLRQAAHLIVRLDLEGAIHLTQLGTSNCAVEMTYLPAGIEGSTRAESSGQMIGFTSLFVARIAQELAKPGQAAVPERIRAGIQSGLNGTRRLFREGFGPALAKPIELTSALKMEEPLGYDYVTVNVAPLAGRDSNSRLLDYVRQAPLLSLAESIVTHGVARTIPSAPIARFGALETLDRPEIECFRSIRNLIGEYLAQLNPERPLSIAVFGPPGSGKSFGVAQVAKSVGDVEKLEFNVAQFESSRHITAAFHAVRDSLVRGRTPLVFFDEFDAAANGQLLGWLKHFLAPMQDGKYVDGESAHLIGRAIFVFAGGTKPTFAQFARISDADFIDAKGPDFVSRLRGYVNVRGTDGREPSDDMHVIRRAVLLRSLLQRKTPAIVNPAGVLRIDAGVRRAFLRCRSFRHGARSMEALIDMSLLAGRETFERASLPSIEQLDLQVNAREFMDLATLDVALSEHREQLAQAIHQLFLQEQTGKKPANDPSMKTWDELPSNYHEDNRAQADDIERKLDLIGCGFQIAKKDDGLARIEFSPEQIEILAEAEHNRWNDFKRAQGYIYGPKKCDTEPKTHPCLVPWSDLPEIEKDKDRNTAKAIPGYLQSVGFQVIKLP